MNPNFILMMPKFPVMMAEDCSVPCLRNRKNREKRKATRPVRKHGSTETNAAFLRMLLQR